VLKVWFQSPGLRQLKDAVQLAETTDIDSLEDLIRLVVACDKIFLSVYHNLSTACMSRDVCEVFGHLKTVRRQNNRTWVWQSTRPQV